MKELKDFANLRRAYDRAMRGPAGIGFGRLTTWGLNAPPDLNLRRLLGRPARVLEVGCGQGHLLEKAHRQLRPERLVGVDLSEVMARIAWQRLTRRRKTDRIQVMQAEATALPFPDSSFDAVLSMHMMEHLDDEPLSRFMAEARRVLKPGGRLLAWTFSDNNFIIGLGQRFDYSRQMVGRSADRLCSLANQAGFQRAEKARLGLFYPFNSAVLAHRD